MSLQDRISFVRSYSLCFNCLARSHSVRQCSSKHKCRICHKKHNTLLHAFDTPKSIPKLPELGTKDEVATPSNSDLKLSPLTSTVNNFLARESTETLLATALIRVTSYEGQHQVFRALIDLGSDTSFITTRAVQLLGLKLLPTAVHIAGLANTLTAKSRSLVDVQIGSLYQENFNLDVTAVVLSTLTDFIPSKKINFYPWPHLKGLTLADPQFNKPGKIDMLLGSRVYASIIQEGLKRGPPRTPTAQHTVLGWILFGEVVTEDSNDIVIRECSQTVYLNFCNQTHDCEQLRKFWEIEDVPSSSVMSLEDTLCEQHFRNTHSRDSDGRYTVRLPFVPFQENVQILGSSRDVALKRFQNLKRRLRTDPVLDKKYRECLNEYLALGHMERVSSDLHGVNNYLPHHAVFKADSATTKTRVVFDALCKTNNGFSLNNLLLTGPALQRDIALLLFEWRQRKYVFMADIQQMYRQIRIHPLDRDFQRILWRPTLDAPLEDFRLTTVTFGVSSAPFLAIRCLHQLARDEGSKFPLGAKLLVNDLYVDDVLSGGDSLEEAIESREQIDKLLKRGKFELRKWVSNSSEILGSIPKAQRLEAPAALFNKDNVIKTLGVYWNPSEDKFFYQIQLRHNKPPFTKRSVLSEIARIYDPLGWLAPVTITAKIFLQTLWQMGLSWDEALPVDAAKHWLQFSSELALLGSISIPRYLNSDPEEDVQLHGFSDASEVAYAASLYIRTEVQGKISVLLVASKTKVAPVKSITLPRLELCGAVLLSRLLQRFQASVKARNHKVFAWTDSTIVLSWIRRHPNNFKTFVSNRISQIIENVGAISWRHVPSRENPADLASRGISPSRLINEPMWWQGPSWLSRTEQFWPQGPENRELDPNILKLKPSKVFHGITISEDLHKILNKFSSLTRLLRVTAWLTAHELEEAKTFWTRVEQNKYFLEEIELLSQKTPISKSSRLISLHPFLDSAGLLRVGARLENAPLTFNERHPVILDPKSYLTKLFIDQAHLASLHGGITLTLSLLRKTLWIIGARNTVKGIIRKCIPCFRHSKQTQSQLMGSLPTARVSFIRPFYNVGVDYAGPFNLRISKIRNSRICKGYLAIFVCMFTKAIHVEVVSDLTSDAFLAAFRRFVSRRGLCRNVYSDRGTNFVGAKNKLDLDLENQFFQANKYTASIMNLEGVEWHFIPPASPHFGGLWEAGVKSVKTHLKRVIGHVNLTFEEMSTLTAQVEACLNSRPLCPLSNDTNDLRVLTPGHFLIGDAPLAIPEEDLSVIKYNTLDRWHLIQRLKQDIWKAWSREYFLRLQQRSKWKIAKNNIKTGDMIVIKDENIPPSRWALGRVTQTHPGNDGFVRVVTVITQKGELKRPVTKVCLLPVETPCDSDLQPVQNRSIVTHSTHTSNKASYQQ